MKMLNCGCGDVYHKKWINIDFNAKNNPDIISHNLLKGLPFPNNSFDCIYHSNFLEHLTPGEAKKFMNECYRVLKPNGLLRVTVPDLENVCNKYLELLKLVRQDENKYNSNYTYITIELLDQMARNSEGGLLEKCLSHKGEFNKFKIEKKFLYERIGSSYTNFKIDSCDDSQNIKWNFIIELLLKYSKWFQYYMAGKYVLSGEQHKWMYDSYSLKKLFEESKFKCVKECKYNESAIPNFEKYRLEEDRYGKEYKPNSIYIEGRKFL